MSKSDTPNGLSLPELKEVANCLKDKEPELEATLDRLGQRPEPRENGPESEGLKGGQG